MRKILNYFKNGSLFGLTLFILTNCHNKTSDTAVPALSDSGTTGLILPQGFVASIVADSLGPVRHLAVNKKGNLYVKLAALKNGSGIFYLSDTNHDGKMDKSIGFGNYPGTGLRIQGNSLYASSNSAVYKYMLNDQEEVMDTGNPQTLILGLVDHGRDNAKAIALDDSNNIYVAVGSYDETCSDASGKGMANCPLLDSVGGIWRFSTNKTDQHYQDAVHYAKGLKNVVALDWNEATGSLFAAPHGRGGLHSKFPALYTEEQDKILPAENLYELKEGADAGWPFVYYDPSEQKQIVSPEYGGDGKKSADKYLRPEASFPAHLGPNDMLFYTGSMFPEKYKNGAFIVFHNQTLALKKGFLVAFVPFKNGKPSGPWEIFADNFAGVDPGNPKGSYKHRPIGIAQGPDGELYVADDLLGTIFKIIYRGEGKR